MLLPTLHPSGRSNFGLRVGRLVVAVVVDLVICPSFIARPQHCSLFIATVINAVIATCVMVAFKCFCSIALPLGLYMT